MADETLWYYSNGGEQLGPVTPEQLQELAAQGGITPETNLWTDGLEEWVSATAVEGLFAQEAAPATPVATPVTPPAPIVSPTGMAAAPTAAPVASPTPVTSPAFGGASPALGGASPALAGAAPMATQIPEGGDYPVEAIKKASFGKLLGFFLGGLAIMFLGLGIGGAIASGAEAANPGNPDSGKILTSVGILVGGYVVGSILCTIAFVLLLMYLHRAWNILRWNQPRTTPGKAVGFLFIPCFNIYWIYVAYRGLAEDWNRTMASFPDLTLAPRMSSGLFLTYCICVWTGIGMIVAPIILLIMFSQICRGINFMASRATMQARPGGLQLY